MAESTYTLFRGTTSGTTSAPAVVFTTPTDTAVSVNEIIVTNPTTVNYSYSISLADFSIATTQSVPGRTSQYITLNQVIYNGETIKTGSSSTTSIVFSISGNDVI
jgi:hypothetical protein